MEDGGVSIKEQRAAFGLELEGREEGVRCKL